MGDKTQYEYNNEIYGKGRLVLSVIESQMAKPDETYQNLKTNLESIPATSQIVMDVEEYQRKYAVSDDIQRRYFTNDPLVDHEGVSFYVSNQWGRGGLIDLHSPVGGIIP